MPERTLVVRVVGDSKSLERAFTRSAKSGDHFALSMRGVARSTGGFTRGFASGAGALSSFGGALALTSGSFFAGAGLVAGLKASVNAAGDFQRTLNVLQSVSGATAKQMRAVSREATKLGADITLPATSAVDAAQAMTELAKGGLTVVEAMNAARGTLQLAAAAQTDVTTAAQISARTLTAFALSGGAAGGVADALANAASAATGDITDFAIALQQSATVSAQFGFSAKDTVAALTVLAKAGLVGSDAGTSLRVMLSRLVPTSKQAREEMKRLGVTVTDAQGGFLPLRNIIENYSKALVGLAPAERQHALQTIFGTDAQRAANIILAAGVQNYDALRAAVGRQGGAARLAAAQQKGFKGALDAFNSALQTTEVTLGTALLPALTKYLRQSAVWLSDTKNQQRIQHDFMVALADTKTVLGGLKSIVEGVDRVTGGFTQTLELLVAIKLVPVLASWTAGFNRLIGAETGAGLAGAASSAGLLRKRLLALAKIGTIAIAISLVPKAKPSDNPNAPSQNPAAKFFGQLPIFGGIFSQTNRLADKLVGGLGLTPGAPEQKRRQKDAFDAGRALFLAFNAGLKTGALKPPTGAFGKPAPGVRTSAADAALRRRPAPPKPLTPAQRNTFFDNALTRQLDRVQDLGLKQQLSRLGEIASLIQQRIAKTKDITRKLKLEDDLFGVFRQEKAIRSQMADEFLAALQFGLVKAQTTLAVGDDLKALAAIQKQLEARIKAEGKTNDLVQQLFDVRRQQVAARQFRALGLGATGEEIAPLQTKALKSQLGAFSKAVEGSFLDTKKTQSLLSKIRKVLGGGLGALSDEVRSKIRQMLDDLDQQLKDHTGPDTSKFVKANKTKLLAGLGLSPDEVRRVRARLSQVGAGGTVPRGSAGAPAGGGHGDIVVVTQFQLDGRQVAVNTTRHQDRRGRKNPGQRRGPHAGA